MAKNIDTVPIEVSILTVDHDIKGAEIYPRNANQSPRRYNFLEIHMDYVLMVHPSTQAVFKDSGKTQEDIARFRDLRLKLNQTKPF